MRLLSSLANKSDHSSVGKKTSKSVSNFFGICIFVGQKREIMELPNNMTLQDINKKNEGTLMESLGIEYTFIGEGRVEATMPVDSRTMQPFGILHGGATIALAETICGVGSILLCEEDEVSRGMQVSANHVYAARSGYVKGIATLLHKGRSTHVWNIDVFTDDEKLVSSVRITNSIIKKK